MARAISQAKRQQAYQKFMQSQVIRQGNEIVEFANMCAGIRQLSTAGMTETGAALMFGIPGRNHRSMKSDLSDGTECKGATSIHTVKNCAQWAFSFPSHDKVEQYQKAPRIVLTEYYEAQGRKVVDTYVVSGQDKVFREFLKRWEDSDRNSDVFHLQTPKGGEVAHSGLGRIHLPLVCRAEENEQGRMKITHWQVDECKRATDLAKAKGVDALSPKQKEKFLCKKG